MRLTRSREAMSAPRAGSSVRLAVVCAVALAACGSPQAPGPVSGRRPGGPPARPSPTSLFPAKVHPSPPSVRWQATLSDVSLARYRAEGPVPSPALTPEGTLVVGFAGALLELGMEGQLRWRQEAPTLKTHVYPVVAGDGTIGGLSTFGWLVLLDRQGRQIIRGGSLIDGHEVDDGQRRAQRGCGD